MAFTVGEREVRQLTADEVLEMARLGVPADIEDLELLEGVLVRMSPKSERHEYAKLTLVEWLASHAVAGEYHVRVETPVRVPDRTSLPEPDVSVVERTPGRMDYAVVPRLVVEIAVTSVRADLHVKAPLLAAAGVPEMWVVEPDRRRVLVLDRPGPDGYARSRTLEGDAELAPRHVEVPPLALTTLFLPEPEPEPGTAARVGRDVTGP